MKKSLFVLLFLCAINFIDSQTFNASLAKDCSKDRVVCFGKDSLFLPAGLQLIYAPFNHHELGMGNGAIHLDSNYYPQYFFCDFCSDSFYAMNKNIFEECNSNSILFDSVWIDSLLLTKGNYYYFVFTTIAPGTLYQEPICAPLGVGTQIINVATTFNSIPKHLKRPEKYVCSLDTNMYGVFQDPKSKEKLWFGSHYSFVKYQSSRGASYIDLIVSDYSGWLFLSFPNSNNPSETNLLIWYNKDHWVLAGRKPPFSKSLQKPQYFYKLK